ncbi:class I SAM-dependent methyltransferase [Patulibacter sp.]|uniref:class I SAM-dependent methyltransferase n=1 Tax=Patulibacter sp. TaxID=1912859 RepID=UPI00271A29B1|nr:class I SAM-dependent methyltransferase [Patulibacter sp.]MDO9408891.1 class I SAM-dependent methyltransferase [Patulibacter sp.]
MTALSAPERALSLMDPPVGAPRVTDGYLDLLGPAGEDGRVSLAQRAMRSTVVPKIYERAWRPFLFTLWTLRTTGAEERLVHDRLHPVEGDVVLDVACGPGNTTRRLRASYDGGLVVGFDYSATMLARATADTYDPGVAYVRGDAHRLPFADGSCDVVSCLGALYLVEDPFRVVDELLRVLAPGGRIAILTTCDRGPAPFRALTGLTEPLSGLRTFAPDAFTSRFEADGLEDVRIEVSGVSQTVSGRRPGEA